jgi:hypothetical protein
MNVNTPGHHVLQNASHFVIKDSTFIYGSSRSDEDLSSIRKRDEATSESKGQIRFTSFTSGYSWDIAKVEAVTVIHSLTKWQGLFSVLCAQYLNVPVLIRRKRVERIEGSSS